MMISEADKQNSSTVAMTVWPYDISFAEYSADAVSPNTREISLDKLKSNEKQILKVVLQNVSPSVMDIFSSNKSKALSIIQTKNGLIALNRNSLLPTIKEKYSRDTSMVSFIKKPTNKFTLKRQSAETSKLL